MAKNYFDKFIEDQLRREAADKARIEKLHAEAAEDPRREILKRRREHLQHLKVWKKNG